MVLDAGHISIESNLADQEALREVQSKKNQSYSSADFDRLEALMYDNFSVRLNDAQLLIGENIDELLVALSPHRAKQDTLHLLERIDLEFALQMSIVADALNLTRFKVAGKLPTLAVNVSNSKYNGLMRIIDASIPNFDRDAEEHDHHHPPKVKASPSQANGVPAVSSRPANTGMRLPSNLFGTSQALEYNVEEEGSDKEHEAESATHKADRQAEVSLYNLQSLCNLLTGIKNRSLRKQNKKLSSSLSKWGSCKPHSRKRTLQVSKCCSPQESLSILRSTSRWQSTKW